MTSARSFSGESRCFSREGSHSLPMYRSIRRSSLGGVSCRLEILPVLTRFKNSVRVNDRSNFRWSRPGSGGPSSRIPIDQSLSTLDWQLASHGLARACRDVVARRTLGHGHVEDFIVALGEDVHERQPAFAAAHELSRAPS